MKQTRIRALFLAAAVFFPMTTAAQWVEPPRKVESAAPVLPSAPGWEVAGVDDPASVRLEDFEGSSRTVEAPGGVNRRRYVVMGMVVGVGLAKVLFSLADDGDGESYSTPFAFIVGAPLGAVGGLLAARSAGQRPPPAPPSPL